VSHWYQDTQYNDIVLDDTQHNNKNATLSMMKSDAYAECYYVDCMNAECRSIVHYATCLMQSIAVLSGFMLTARMLIVSAWFIMHLVLT
jgi:hypothetical protein